MKLNQYYELERGTASRWIQNFLINLLPDLWIINRCVRPFIARLCGMKCGFGVILQKGIFYGNPKNVQIGIKSVVCRRSFLDGFDKIIIGNNVAIAFGATIITSTHEMGPPQKRTGKLYGSPVVIGDGVWVGARVTIAPGVEIGAGSIISAGAALMYSVPANSLVSGVPAKIIAQLGIESGAEGIKDLTAEPEVPSIQESMVSAPATASIGGKDGVMTKSQFYSELEFLLELRPGSVKGTESLGDLPWNSMTILAFIAMADSELHEVASPTTLADCKTVSDLMNLFPGRII
jgi:maltose O-acetyltransferase